MMTAKYQYGTKENRAFLEEQSIGLVEFGRDFASQGGGSYWLGDDGTPWTDRDRETWITCRMAHVYALGALLGGRGTLSAKDCRERSAAAIRGLLGELNDKEHDGWFAAVTAEGNGKGPKQCYAHAFVILAATSGVLAGIDEAKELLTKATAVYDRYFWDEARSLAVDTWDTAFETLDPYRGINANMHTVEAFLAVADACGDESYRERAGKIIAHVLDWARNNEWRIPEHYGEDWLPDLECNKEKPDDPFKPYGATPGHGIEWARLITQWALSTFCVGETNPAAGSENAFAAPYIQAAEKLYRRAVTDGWNVDGARGIVYTTDWEGQPVVHDRMHWTLAEAINTSAVLYRVTGKEEYAKDYAAFMQYLDECVIDHKNGSWFHQMDAENKVMTTVWPGKSDLYHAEQAMLIPYQNPAISIATALARQ